MEIFEEIKNRVGMRDVLELYGIYPVRGNNIYRCFAHDDKKPSANIVKGCEKFHCFSCNFTGDIFDVVQHFEKCDRKQAMRIIDTKFNLGVYRQLSHREKLELARKQKERERERAEKLAWEQYEKSVLKEIREWLWFWKQVQNDCHLTKRQYNNGTWEEDTANLFFFAIKQQEWLNWLYNAICGFDHPECEFDYLYPTDKKQILEIIKKGEIEVW